MEDKIVMRKQQKRKNAMTVFLAVVLILLVGTAGVVSFLTEKYKPGTRKMDGKEYFQLQTEEEAALVVNGEVLEEKACLVGGEPFVSYDWASSKLNSCFYWDEDSQGILFTTAEGIKTLFPGDASVFATPGGQPAVQRKEDGTVILSLDVVKQVTDMEYCYYPDPARVVIRTDWENLQTVTVTADTCAVRQKGGIKSAVLTEGAKGDTFEFLEDLGDWMKVCTKDGYVGYVPEQKVSGPAALQERERQLFSYDHLTRDHKINLVWHQTTSQEANAALAQMTASVAGINVISPTWFSVVDSEGNLSSLANAEYVNQAHASGWEVWGLIDNFNENFDSAAALAHASVRTKIISGLMEQASAVQLDGINVDFEHLSEAAIPHFLQFLRELTLAAHQQNLVVSVDTPVPQNFTAYYNRGEQARFCDYMIMMGYDEHYSGDEEAGSVSSLPFVQNGITELCREVPKEQIICGVPFYTRVWTETFGQDAITSEVLGMDGADEYAAQMGMTKNWDDALGQYVAVAETSSARYSIWMEEEQSIEQKMKLIQEHNLAGVAAWKLGFERSDIWDILSKYLG